ncbi:alpha galactosidase A domain-containing protein [Ditylenchus destructor]|uniref:Alpha-galactosidase n=1 Tax=Ditylenchus destructor TaxID=166010 RepID=A0AAD4NC27_9BILA|nr:alpha galactosidase A domain-containing protein [Ditylenchus destructor]
MLLEWFILYSVILVSVHSLDNGLVRTPPMGWMSWTKYFCETDCEHHPFGCINQDLYKSMADRMAADGYLEVGYEFVHIDDCWMEHNRSADGKLVADRQRFPSGMAALSDYVHKLGLKFAMYEDYGTETCGGYPGSFGYLKEDADTFAEWNVDYLKLDGCYIDTDLMPQGYPEMGRYLNATGRPIVYACSWPAYLLDKPEKVDYSVIGKYCNLWRNYDDIKRSWTSVFSIIQYYNANQDKLIAAQAPGRWNDPDMIIVGNTELSLDQARAQMTIWSIWSAPLIMSNDLRTITPEQKDILQNKRVIAIDQDPLGNMGRMIHNGTDFFVYVKKVTPVDTKRQIYSYAVAVLNHSPHSIHFKTDLASLGLSNRGGYELIDLWSGEKLGHFNPESIYETNVPPTGVAFFKATLPNLKKKMHYVQKKQEIVNI